MTGQDENEMRDLLIRLDQRVDDGFRNLFAKIDEMNRRQDGHETRIRSLEDWRVEVRGGTKGVTLSWKIGSVLIGAVLGILGMVGFQFAVVPKDKPTPKPETTASAIHEE